MKKILILAGRYLPGHKDGGPLRTLINITEALGDEYEFYIGCLDRDHGDEEPYPNIIREAWNIVGKAKVWYAAPGGFTDELILKLAEGKDLIYLSSFYGDYGYKTLLLRRRGRITVPVSLASMGVFSQAALAKGFLKKKVFITGCKAMGLFDGITWSVTSELEAADVKRVMGKRIRYVVAEDLPRTTVPGRSRTWEGPLRLCFLSRICQHKGLDIFLDALCDMDTTNMELSVCGPVQEEDYWKTCLEKLERLNIRWKYYGDIPSEKVPNCLSEQDVLVLPTKSENYGHVVFEALSVGCIPVISEGTPWGVVQERDAGYVVKRDAQSFREALLRIAAMSGEEKQHISQAAVKLAADKVKQSKEETGYRVIFG